MFRSLCVWISLVSVGASRIQDFDTKLETEFGASCDDLQTRFHTQVHAFRAAFEAQTSESMTTQARFTMRMFGVIRTLRRAQECSWVIENNSDDMEDMRSIVEQLLAGNPCGEAARSELEAAVSSDGELQTISRAMSILLSDDCEVSEVQEDDAQDDVQDQQGADEQLQDSIDEMMDAEEEGEGAFIQMDQTGRFRRFMRAVGVFFLMLFLLLACVGAAAVIGFFLGAFIVFPILRRTGLIQLGHSGYEVLSVAFLGTLAGGTVGLVGCANQLYTNLLPRVSQ